MYNPKRQGKPSRMGETEMAKGLQAVSAPKVTIHFQNDPDFEFFENPLGTFYSRVIYLVNRAARERGGSFSILFRTGGSLGIVYASIQWCEKTILLVAHPTSISVWLSEKDTQPACSYRNEDNWHITWKDVLAPMFLGYHEWRVYKLEKELAEAKTQRAAHFAVNH